MADTIKLAEIAGDEDSLQQRARRWKQYPAIRVANASLEAAKDFVPSVLRLATSLLRHLPTAVIVGAKRAGTRRLYTHLLKHPRCFGAVEKEIDYFSEHADRSVAWYRSRFPMRGRVSRCEGHVIEVSPSYLPTPSALRQMKKVLPKARVIVILRDPVSRAFAHYQHDKVRYVERRSFADAVADELGRCRLPAQRGVALAPDAAPMLGYVARGYYALQLELLLKVYPRNKVTLIDSASLTHDMAATCNRIFDFLGLEDFDVQPKPADVNDGRESIDPRVEAALREHYRPHDQLLADVVGQQFSWMSPQAEAA
jgi:hypothetical protein